MNNASSLRHRRTTRHKAADRRKSTASAASRLFVFTIDADTAQIVKFETIDGSGARHELSQEEKASLIRADNGDRVEEVLEQAFEAGIACGLGDELSERQAGKSAETDEEAELRHLLLAQLMEEGGIKHFTTSEVLNRAIVGTLIQHAIASAGVTGGRGTTPAPRERAASTRTN